MTVVVHVNDPRFRDNPDAVYIGRRNYRAIDKRCHKDSPWCNPFKAVSPVNRQSKDPMLVSRAIASFEGLLRKMLDDQSARDELLLLDGAVLGCWCKKHGDEPCHGDVLVKLIEEVKALESQK